MESGTTAKTAVGPETGRFAVVRRLSLTSAGSERTGFVGFVVEKAVAVVVCSVRVIGTAVALAKCVAVFARQLLSVAERAV